ncbi:TonB-dependent receptor [Pedobacter sp. AW31-3R]|uniref:TonB-dependent receptor n=1 Tax=Pedobacter sp. AW31-3R TaxID=3445781 RepID=UPI003F9FE1AB
MQIKKILLTGILCAIIFCVQAQKSNTGGIKGKLSDEQSLSIASATVRLMPLKKEVVTDNHGNYIFTQLPAGNYTIHINALGFEKQERKVTVKVGQVLVQNFSVVVDGRDIEEVAIVGLSKNKKISQEAYNVSVIDAKKLYNTTMDIGQALNRVSGVRLRESGGVGSNMTFSLNGFSGNQVKMFLDGLPMDNFGSSFQLNNIPVNFAERVEVYRGVVPVWLGGDALGGAVNIVSKTDPGKYLDASYSFGSFNTHKTNINAGFVDKNGFTVQLNAFQNYSDNNYWVNMKVADLVSGIYSPVQRVRRFHNTYHNETVVANVGVSNKKYADQLLLSLTVGNNRSEVQTGNIMEDVYGGRETRGSILQPGIKYLKKDLFLKGLNVSVTGRFNLGKERSLDTVPRRFNWLGESVPRYPNNPEAQGGESSLTDYRYKNNNGLASANVSYDISEKHSLMLNHMYSTFNRTGLNTYFPDLPENRFPKKTSKNITGLGYRIAWNEKWNTNLFVKQYNQKNSSYTYLNEVFNLNESSLNKTGYGVATTYFLKKDLQFKLSYEMAYRLPEGSELFGDGLNQIANPDLKPENSDNINVGLSYFFKLNHSHRFSVDANYVYRSADDYIRAVLGSLQSNGSRTLRYENQRSVRNNSVDANLRYYYKNLISLGGNITYQNLINTTKGEPGKLIQSTVYKDRLPNTPYLFGNADANINFANVRSKGDVLSIGYNLLYVHEFFLDWPSLATPSERFTIPGQLSHDVNMVYTMASGKYNIALECLNITDVTRYDNFAMQKPSRSFNVKLRYFINR